MKRFLVLAFAIVCGMAYSDSFASQKNEKKGKNKEQSTMVIDDEFYYYQDGYGKAHHQTMSVQMALNNAKQALQFRVPNDSMEVEMVSNKFYYDAGGNTISEVIIRVPRKHEQANESTKNSKTKGKEQLCDATDNEMYFYQKGEGKHPDISMAQMEALENAKQLLQLRAKCESMELELVCNQLTINEYGYYVSNVVVRIPKIK